MRTSKFSEAQILSIIKQYEDGMKVADICQEHEISAATFYNWRSRHAQTGGTMAKRVKELEEENARLKEMYADARLETVAMKEALHRK